MLHAYELGMLSNEERRQLEFHLLDCPSCRENIAQFQEAMQLIRQDGDIRGIVDDLAQEEEEIEDSLTTGQITKSPRRRLLPTLVPATVIALVALFILIMKPWQIEISPTQDAIAAENRLAIMYFDNLTDPEDATHLGEILTNLLITDLAESRYIRVVSYQRLYDILKSLDREGARKIDIETATLVAQNAHARWMLMGNILQVEPHLVVTAQLVDVETGNAVAAQQVTGETDESFFAVVDRLSVEIKNDLELPAEAWQEIDRPVAEVTTHSPEAYRLYLVGVNEYYKFYYEEARKSFEEALTHDSTMAMAYYYLAILKKDRGLIEKAVKYAKKASHREQSYIRYRELAMAGKGKESIAELEKMVELYPDEKLAWNLLGTHHYSVEEIDKSIYCLKRAIEIDPLYKAAINQLAYTYNRGGDFDRAIETINLYISLAPEEANPYDSRAEIFALNGKIDEAIKSYKMALEKKPDFRNSLDRLVLLNTLNGDYYQAEEYLTRQLAVYDSLERSMVRIRQAYIPLYQGKFEEALVALDSGIRQMKQELGKEKHASYHIVKAFIYAEQGRWDQALVEQQKCLEIIQRHEPKSKGGSLDLYIQLLAESGNIERAEQVADSFKTLIEDAECMSSDYMYARGCIELERGNADEAVVHLEKAAELADAFSYSIHFTLSRAYLEAGQYEQAAKKYESLLKMQDMWVLYWGIWTVKSYYYLAVAQENLGLTDKAAKNFHTFLDIWKNADSGIEELDDARQRLTHLENKS
jgi:tetratricopeptide (TPR) repeat protein